MTYIKPSVKSKEFLEEVTKLVSPAIKAMEHRRDVIKTLDLQIDGELTNLTDEEEKIKKLNEQGGVPIPVPERLKLINSQIDDCVSYCMGIVSEQNRMYQAIETPDKQDTAKKFAAIMNHHALTYDHFGAVEYSLYTALRYNLLALVSSWDKTEGSIIVPSTDAESNFRPTITVGTVKEGNKIKAINPANLLLDARVEPAKVSTEGQYFGYIYKTSAFKLQKDGYDLSLLKNNETLLETKLNIRAANTKLDYVLAKSAEEKNLDELFPSVVTNTEEAIDQQYHVLHLMLFWPRSEKEASKFDLWSMTVIHGIPIKLERVENHHGMLPIGCAVPSLGSSAAEKLIPLQNAATHKFNLSTAEQVGRTYGTKFYNKNLFPDLSIYSPLAANIPFDPKDMEGFKIDEHIKVVTQPAGHGDTSQILSMYMDLMNKILPTGSRDRLGDLERVTKYQAASLVNASNLPMLRFLRTVHAQALSTIVQQMVYNTIMEYQADSVSTVAGGQMEELQVTRSDLLDFSGEINIGTGLKGIDRLTEAELLRDILGMVIQSQEAIQETDIIKLIDHYTSIVGDHTDYEQFRKQDPLVGLVNPDGTLNEKGIQAAQILPQILQQMQAQAQEVQGDQSVEQPPQQ